MSLRRAAAALLLTSLFSPAVMAEFEPVEAGIEGIHDAIRSGETTCREVVEAYVARARAYNGSCTVPVTRDGGILPEVFGPTRAGVPLKFGAKSVAVGDILPDFDKYTGTPLDFGRLEPTRSDPSVYQVYGMVTGISHARQVGALATVNLRGERSVTCKGDFDKAPSEGALPAGAPASCEDFRRQPDALEYASELDAEYGRNPDLEAMPLYCVPMAFKSVYDATDMRSAGGGDVAYATDAAPEDSTVVARMRKAGAIIYAEAVNSEYNGGSGNPGGDAKAERVSIGSGSARETWGGTTCNPYDTTRDTGGSSGGSGSSVSSNLVTCAICESTGGSCRNPATMNGVINLIATKGTFSFGGAIGSNPWQDRPGIHCKTVADAVRVLDAMRADDGTFFDPRDPYTALSHLYQAKRPASFATALSDPAASKPLAGMTIGVVRELMVKFTVADDPVVDGINRELAVLRELGAQLVELPDPQYPDDVSIPNAGFTLEDALAEIVPFHMPEILTWKNDDGTPRFSVTGWDVSSRKYLVAAASHKAPWPVDLNFRTMIGNPPRSFAPSGYQFSYQFAEYLFKRGDAKVYDWETLNANAKYYDDSKRAAAKNWENKEIDPLAYDTTFQMKRREVMRMAMMKVMDQNGIDAFVYPSETSTAGKIGRARAPARRSFGWGAVMGTPEVFVPAGYAEEVYDATFELSADGKTYEAVPDTTPTEPESPLPFNIGFMAAPGDEAVVIKVGSAYENATHHRRSPPDFGPLQR